MREFEANWDKEKLDNFEDEAYNAIADTIDEGAECIAFGEVWRFNLKNAAREYEELGWPLKKGYMLKGLKAAARKYIRDDVTQRGESVKLDGSTLVISMPSEAGYRAYQRELDAQSAARGAPRWPFEK